VVFGETFVVPDVELLSQGVGDIGGEIAQAACGLGVLLSVLCVLRNRGKVE
jgi:hypothetical protein